MKRFALTLAALAATVTLTSCGSDEPKHVARDAPVVANRAPADDLATFNATQIAGHMAEANTQAKWLWYLGDVEISDGDLRVTLSDERKDSSVEICEALREAVRASKLKPMLVTVASEESGFPLAQANPKSEFGKGCET